MIINKQIILYLPAARSSHVLQVVPGAKPLIPESRPVGGWEWGKDVTDDVT